MERIKKIPPAFLCLILFLPFIGRPFFFDDGSVVMSAVAAARSFLRPYHFDMDLGTTVAAWPVGGLPIYTHPPLTGWLLGLAVRCFGPSEIPLHAVMFLVSVAGLLLVQRLANRFCRHPWWVAFFCGISPAYFLTSLTLYPHLVYFVFYLASLEIAFQLHEKPTPGRGLLWGILLTLAALSLYEWPLLFLLTALVAFSGSTSIKKRGIVFASAALVFAVVFGAWSIWEWRLYGLPGVIASYKVRVVGSHAYKWSASFLPLVFLTGCAPLSVLAWPLLLRRSQKLVGILAGLLIVSFIIFSSPWGGFSRTQSAMMAFLAVTGAAFVLLALKRPEKQRRQSWFLLIWFLLEYGFTQAFLTLPSGHHLLLLTLIVVLTVVQFLEAHGMFNETWMARGGAVLVLFTLLLAHGDWSQAQVAPKLARDLPRPSGERVFFWGNSFGTFEHYLKEAGWTAWNRGQPPQKGDLLLVARWTNAHSPISAIPAGQWTVVEERTYTQKNPVRTFSTKAGAGWYSASWGPLPYWFSTGPVEQFYLLRYEGN